MTHTTLTSKFIFQSINSIMFLYNLDLEIYFLAYANAEIAPCSSHLSIKYIRVFTCIITILASYSNYQYSKNVFYNINLEKLPYNACLPTPTHTPETRS